MKKLKQKLRAYFAPLLAYFAPSLKILQQKMWLYGLLSDKVYDPDFWTIALPDPKPKKDKAKEPTAERPADINIGVGTAYKVTKEENGAIQFADLRYQDEKLTEADEKELLQEGVELIGELACVRAAALKKLFAKDKSIEEMVEAYLDKGGKSQYGYARTTIAKHVRAFNRAKACQTVSENS